MALVLVLGVQVLGIGQLAAQSVPTPLAPDPARIGRLQSQGDWDAIVRELADTPSRSPELNFDLGSALAHLGRLDDAERVLVAGERQSPADPRFPIERAGIAFKQKRYAESAHLLRRALRLAPSDPYANDFLGTVYFLDDNLSAALKYWNRVGKPRIAEVIEDPVPRVSPALLDRAFLFSPASQLKAAQLLDTQTRVGGLGIFAQSQFDLRARPDGAFDLAFRNQEKNGFGDSRLEAVVSLLSDLPFQGITPVYDNFHGQAANISSLLRWDAQKRRFFASFSAPFEHSAKYRFALKTDLRNENWQLRAAFAGNAPVLASLNLRRQQYSFSLASFARSRIGWRAGAEVSDREFRSVVPGAVLTPAILAAGWQLKQSTGIDATLLRIPERRFTLQAGATSDLARLWSASGHTWDKLQGSLGWRWLPQATGEDYQAQQQIRAGRTFGQPPFDELSMLGLERDNDLPLHAHVGTRDGRKGSAPLGRDYLLGSSEIDKILYRNGLLTVKLGPLFDLGKITDPGTRLGSEQWLFDLGAVLKVRVFSTTVGVSYGRDLRAGHNAFYAALAP